MEIESKLNARHFSLRNAFRAFDLNKDSKVTEGEFIAGLVQINVDLSES